MSSCGFSVRPTAARPRTRTDSRTCPRGFRSDLGGAAACPARAGAGSLPAGPNDVSEPAIPDRLYLRDDVQRAARLRPGPCRARRRDRYSWLFYHAQFRPRVAPWPGFAGVADRPEFLVDHLEPDRNSTIEEE